MEVDHGNDVTIDSTLTVPTCSESTESDIDMQVMRKRTMWILKLKEKRQLTQTTVNELLSDITDLFKELFAS